MDGLAFIGKIVEKNDIPTADYLATVTVICGKGGKWKSVVKKDEIPLGSLVEVYLPDSILPEIPKFEFMRQRRFRVRQSKFKGEISSCLVMPLGEDLSAKNLEIGTDITEIRGVKKYEKPVPLSMRGEVVGKFPEFIPKTDEPHLQGALHLFEQLKNNPYYITLKYDGCSGTAYIKDGKFGVCSRTLELRDTPKSLWWAMAKKYNLEAAIRDFMITPNLAVQFEVIGEKVQGNPLGIKGNEIRVFDLFNIDKAEYGSYSDLLWFTQKYDIPMVKTLASGAEFDMTEKELYDFAEGVEYRPGVPGEGIVVRRTHGHKLMAGERVSFKVINPKYKERG
jgi:RNA ligase (TIGR02306 family)